MGSSSSKASSSNSTSYSDQRQAVQNGVATSFYFGGDVARGAGSSVAINMTDSGAIAGAFDFGKAALEAGIVKDAMLATNFDNMLKATNESIAAAAAQAKAAQAAAAESSRQSAQASSATAQAAIASNERGLGTMVDFAEGLFATSMSLVDRAVQSSGQAFNDAAGVINNAYAAAEAEKKGSLDQRTIIMLSVVGAVAVVAYANRGR